MEILARNGLSKRYLFRGTMHQSSNSTEQQIRCDMILRRYYTTESCGIEFSILCPRTDHVGLQ